jgi:hypothetical protein
MDTGGTDTTDYAEQPGGEPLINDVFPPAQQYSLMQLILFPVASLMAPERN